MSEIDTKNESPISHDASGTRTYRPAYKPPTIVLIQRLTHLTNGKYASPSEARYNTVSNGPNS